MRTTLTLAAICGLLAPLSSLARAGDRTDDWPEYRGPTANGHAASGAPPLRWSETENVRWKTPLRGRGWSTPVVADGRAWMTTATEDGHRLAVVCVDVESGEVLHDDVVFEVAKPEPKNRLNSFASPSPVLDGGHVYVHFGRYGTACLDAETAAPLWSRRDLSCDHMEGPGSSPILVGDRLVFHMDGGDVQYLVALDRQSGETAWRTDRSADLDALAPDLRKAYGTPVLVERGDDRQLISQGAQAIYGYRPDDGAELWRVDYRGFSAASRPLLFEDLLILSTGFMKAKLLAVDLARVGETDEDPIAWQYTGTVPTMSSGIVVDDRIYLVGDDGIVACLDARTGERRWRERLDGAFCASPVLAAGRLYFFDREGSCTVIAPEPEYRELARNELDDGLMASPVVLGDALLLRTRTHLYRIEE